jgi:hypothetical protein
MRFKLKSLLGYITAGIIFLSVVYYPISSILASPPYDGGTGDGWGLSNSSDTSLGGPRINFTSQAIQSFFVADSATVISPITISQEAASGITALNDIRIRIPSDLAMNWDTTDTTATITDVAQAKVSSTVSYPDNKTLLIDVTSDFSSGDAIVISGLAFKDFTATSTGKLSLDIFNSSIKQYWDINDKLIGVTYTFGDGWAYDVSRSRCLTPPAIIAPQGGESWIVNSVHPITWSTSGFSGTTLKLQYSKDDFSSNITNITGASSLTVNTGTFSWTIPDDIYSAVKVRFVDNANPDVTDASEGFKIIGAFDITSPDGGESWAGGSTHNITWTTTGTISLVKLEYSLDNFVSDIHTIGAPPIINTGSYSWIIPTITSSTVKVRVSYDADSTVYNTSAANFTITGLQLTSPNGAEEWEKGYTHSITWKSVGTVANDIVLKYSVDGSTWQFIDSGQPATGSYPWSVPNDVSSTVKVKVYSASAEATIYDVSDSNFTIAANPKLTITSPNGAESWEVGKVYNITWNKTGRLYSTVDLYYSTDGGGSWIAISSGQTNSGTYVWTVPDAVGTQVKVKVIEAGVPAARDTTAKVEDASDANFSIIEPTITITSPNGAETWAYGDTRNITWTTTGTVSNNLLLEYSKDDTNWITIATAEANDGIYSWILPDDPAQTVKVRITDNNRTQIKDTSNNYFTLLSRPRITIAQPNGGELLTIGDSYSIKWNIDGQITSHYVKIEYSKDDFVLDAQPISNYTPNDGDFTWLSVADDTSSTVKIRITDLETGFSDVTDTSDNYFEIRLPSVTVTSPNGGESWYATGVYPITWTKEGVVGNLTLEYSLDNGGTWTTIATDVSPNLGTYTWTLPNNASSQCFVRIKDPLRSTTTDTSNAAFNIIAPSITLTSPNGAESWIVGTEHNITWTSIGTNGSVHNNLTLQYSTNGGSSWTNIATGEANDGTYSWSVADTVSTACRIKIFDASRAETVDTSDANFAISSPTLTITSPNGAEQWVIGTQHNITWTSVGSISANNLKLEYSSDGGSTWTTITTGEVNDGSYAWTVPDTVSGTCKVRITDTGRSDTPQDTSDGVFAILVPQITVTKPNGGELWTVGDTEQITWSVVGQLSGNLKLEYSKDNFISDVHLIDGAVTNTLTSYNWLVPSDVSTTVRVRITDVGRAASTDKSNGDFTILPTPEITLTLPNGGESWIIGTQHNITWIDNGGPISNNLKLEYTVDGSTWTTIATGEANDGTYSWTVPDNASSTVRVRITDASRTSTTDVSNNYFIIAVPTITITSPNGGESWAVGDSAPVTWITVGSVSNELVFYYSVDAGSTWTTIATNEANDRNYTWTVPNEPSSLARLKIVDGARPATSDTSDANFTIIPVPTITITSPNGGETYVLGETMNITWTSKGLSIGLLKIEYSADNFATSRTIAQDVSNTGSYAWTIPETALSGATIKVRITDQTRSEITDTSDAVFRIRGGFTITAPNGGESWGAKSPQTITWTTKGTIVNVKLEYSLDSGSTWGTITSSVTNTNSYAWILPDAQKTTCRVRVSDASDSTVNAVSAQDFSIVYYTITWKVLDYDDYSDLRNLNVNCSSGWTVSDASLTSPVTHAYPYGSYTTFWSRDGYIERSTAWTADSDKSVILYLENSISAQIEWHVLLSSTYTAETDTLKTNSWLERRGKMVGLTSVELGDLTSAILQIFDGDTLLKEISSTTPDSQGVFSFSWASTGLELGKTYFIKAQIKYRDATYTSGGSIDVTSEKKLYEQKVQLQALQASLEAKTTEIKTSVETQATKTQEKVAEVKTETAKILTAAETTIPAQITTAQEAISATIASEVTPQIKSSVLNTENLVKTGETLTIRYRTFSGLSPTIDVYNAAKKLEINKGGMKEIGATGIYEYPVTFSQNWGTGDFTVICSESTKGVTDALTITVTKTNTEDVYNQVTMILGSTSEINNLKEAADAMNSQFSVIKTALAKIDNNLLIKDAKNDAVGSATVLNPIFVQLSGLSKQVKQVSEKIGINLEKIYKVSADKKNDILYLKNKSQELKAVMELTKKMVDNIANKPVVQTWYEYKEMKP